MSNSQKMVVDAAALNAVVAALRVWEKSVAGTDPDVQEALSVVDSARPLSELCEEEAKRHEVADYGSSNSPMLQEWGRADKEISAAIRSFGSKQ